MQEQETKSPTMPVLRLRLLLHLRLAPAPAPAPALPCLLPLWWFDGFRNRGWIVVVVLTYFIDDL